MKSVTKVVLPVAGLGTRLLPFTKEIPKEMMPLLVKQDDDVLIKPLLQIIFEELYDAGFRNFCFIVGRGKRVIEDYFTPEFHYLELLRKRGKYREVKLLESFYKKILSSVIVWVNQDEPRGFGDAVYRARPFVGNDPFLVHAGDTLVISKSKSNFHLELLTKLFRDLDADAIFLAREVKDPSMYGVVVVEREIYDNVFIVRRVIEKPEKPPSNLAILPLYIFDPLIFKALERTKPSKRGEIELTDAIQKLVDWGCRVFTIKLPKDTVWIDVGTPQTYWEALKVFLSIQ